MKNFFDKPHEITALEPCYGERGGNATRIYTREGIVIVDDRRMQSFIKSLARQMNADIQSMRQNYGKHLGCGQSVPLAFTEKLILAPVKMRIPLSQYDGATGYINLDAYIKVEEVDPLSAEVPKCFILTRGGHRVPSYFSPAAIEKQIKQANIARIYYCHLHDSNSKSGNELAWLKWLWDLFDPPSGPGSRA